MSDLNAAADGGRLPRWYAPSMALAAAVISAWLSRYCFPFGAFDPDSAAYLFQAKLLAGGALAASAPPEFGFSPSPHINIHAGLWFAKYPFGTSLLLAPGVLVGAPWIVPALATGLTLLLFAGIVRELYDARVAALALPLAFISPTTLLMGATLLSQPVSRLCMAAFLYGALRTLGSGPGTRRLAWAVLAGFALGYGFNTRPLVALVFGVAGAGWLSWRIAARPDRATFVGPALGFAAAGLVMVGLFLAWNARLAGDPWLTTYHVLQGADRMGFGLRGEGYAPHVADFRLEFTPAYAFNRLWRHTLPAVLFNAAGWGAYAPSMLFPSDPNHHVPQLAPLLVVPLILLAIPLAGRSRRPADVFCAAILLLTVGAHFFQYSDHGTWGWTPVHSAYYNEATLFGIVPLMARGALLLHARMARRWLGAERPLWVAAGALLLANTIASNLAIVRWLRHWDPHYQQLPGLVAEANLHHAVVFVPESRNAPLGDYPFRPLERANVVYFRLGPLPAWGLNTPDWRLAYDRYFAGRAAYLYKGGALQRLDAAGASAQGGRPR
jgi:4-amino-4-deoxy-L-arabinose transferase-like glycosyltransferase